MTRVTGSISKLLHVFDYMNYWGPYKTRDELFGKPIKYDTNYNGFVVIGKIVDVDVDNDTWIGEIYI